MSADLKTRCECGHLVYLHREQLQKPVKGNTGGPRQAAYPGQCMATIGTRQGSGPFCSCSKPRPLNVEYAQEA